MKYKNFALDKLMEVYNYKYLCDCYLSLAPNSEVFEILRMILYEGRFNNQFLFTDVCNIDNPAVEVRRRLSMVHLLLTYPETFKLLFDNEVALFHGTNANALPSILKNGLYSEVKSGKDNIDINTGEYFSRKYDQRNFVSLTDVLDIGLYYSSISPIGMDNKKLSFDVIIGTTVKDISDKKRSFVPSEVTEVCISEFLPKESIKVILVPVDKVNFVKKLLNNDDILVAPIYKYDDKFWQFNDWWSSNPTFDLEKYNCFKNNRYKKTKIFGQDDLEELSKNRNIFGIKKIIDKLSNIFIKVEGQKEEGQNGRTK